MPITAEQLALGANRTLQTYAKEKPTDNFTSDRPFSKWLVDNMVPAVFGNGVFNEKVRTTNDSNYQNYTRDQQVTYNKKDTMRVAPFYHYEAHDGFALNETELAENGIILTDDKNTPVSEAEMIQIINLLDENNETLTDGFQEKWDLEVHRDGSQSSLAVPGLDLLVSTTPGSTTVGGFDCSVAANAFWKNNANYLTISTATAAPILDAMEKEWRNCIKYGKAGPPNGIFAGSKFFDAYAAAARGQTGASYQVVTPDKGGVNLDGSRARLFFKGVEIQWDPTMDTLQAADNPATNWDKRCYFLNSKSLKLRPFKGRWMIQRKPPRMYDRYTYYFGKTADYGMTVKQRNSMAVLAIA